MIEINVHPAPLGAGCSCYWRSFSSPIDGYDGSTIAPYVPLQTPMRIVCNAYKASITTCRPRPQR